MIEIFNDNGDVREYLTIAERLPSFLAQYGPDKGYAILTSVKGFLDIHFDLKPAYRAAIEAGRKPAEVGLPEIDPALFRFEARLLDSEHNVIAEASALRRINTNIDAALEARLWEAAETAALQRLAARTGFGSDTLLTDELSDMTERGVDFRTQGSEPSPQNGESSEAGAAAPADKGAESSDKPKAGRPRRQSKRSAQPNEAGEPQQRAPAAPATEQPTSTTEASGKTAQTSEVSEALLRQIRHLASVRGIEPPEVTTKAQAKEALKSLRATPAATT